MEAVAAKAAEEAAVVAADGATATGTTPPD